MNEKPRVLIVDDDEQARRMLTLILERHGYQVQPAGSGREAIAEANKTRFEVALLDIWLPDISGNRLLPQLHETHPDMTVIMLAGHASVETAVGALNMGAAAYITKPVKIDQVLAEIRNGIERQRLLREKREAEEALYRSEERYRAFFQASRDCVFITSKEGRWIEMSDVAPRLFGYPSRETLQEVAIPDLYADPPSREAHLRVVEQQGYVEDYPVDLRKRDGSVIHTRITSVPVRGKDGTVTGFMGTIRDVTAQVRAERLLQALNRAALAMSQALTQEEVFVAAARELHALGFVSTMWLADESGCVLSPARLGHEDVDVEAVERLVGTARSEFALDVEDTPVFRAVVRERETVFVEDAVPAVAELLPEHAREHALQVVHALRMPRFIAAPMIVDDRVVGAFTVQSDALTADDVPAVTAFARQMSAEWRKVGLLQELQASLAELERTQDQLVQAQKMEAVGRLAGGVAHDLNNLLTAIEGYVDLASSNTAAGEPVERRAEELRADLDAAAGALVRATRSKDEFLASMSHKLRTPLNAILGISEVLCEGVYGSLNERQVTKVRAIEESGRHLLGLINDVLDVSKMEAGKVELEVGTVVVEEVCLDSLQFIRPMCLKKQLQVSSSLDTTVTTLQADERRLKQILVNLLSNACEFTPEGGAVGLEVVGDAETGVVHLSVWDTGVGIAKEDIERLGQPFAQLDSRLSRQHGGTGLGLSLVRRLSEYHGGSLSIESKVGEGSRFTVSLPWQEAAVEGESSAAQASDVPTSAPVPAMAGSGPLILLAEDDQANVETLFGYLEAKGYRIIVARDGSEAVDLAREWGPDLIVMDIQMPGTDGLEAIRRIRGDADPSTGRRTGLADRPIIALTALAMPGDEKRCLQAGADAYLSKPVRLRQFVQVIAEQLQASGASQTSARAM